MEIKFNKKVVVIFVVLGFLLSFGAGFFIGKIETKCPFCQPTEINFSLFWETYHKVKENFVSPEKVDTQKMIYGAISGMVQSLGDPYTVFLNPDDSKKFLDDVSGSFEGIGAEIGQKKGQIVIIAPIENTPAQKAGLRAGDQIIKINDKFASDLSLDEAVNLIRGPKKTEVILTIYRNEWNSTKEIKIIRSLIEVPSLKWELKDTSAGKVAYIKLYQFSENASNDFQKAANEITSSSAQKIILDLRNNPGGSLDVVNEIAGWFLTRGQVITIEDFGGKKERFEHKALGNEKLARYPIVVLINEGSASASEILAGALRDDRDIKLVGEKSFGKGSVQQLEELTGGSALKVTIAKWLTPSGKLIADIGLEPDVKVEMAQEDFDNNRDPQLDKAIEILKGL